MHVITWVLGARPEKNVVAVLQAGARSAVIGIIYPPEPDNSVPMGAPAVLVEAPTLPLGRQVVGHDSELPTACQAHTANGARHGAC